MSKADSVAKVDALLRPNNIVIVGATDRPGGWPGQIYNNLKRYGFAGNVYPVNPRYETVWGVECYPNVSSLPEKPDHMLVIVPAKVAAATLREGAKAGARSATVFAGGFGESGGGAVVLTAAEMKTLIADSGLAVSGPNCMGNMAGGHRLLTVPDDRMGEIGSGPVAIVGQSGGITTALYRALADRGTRAGYIVMTGNELGLTTADFIRYFTADEDTKVIVSFVETVKDPDDFLDACRGAQKAGKPIVMFKIGGSAASRAAALAHTGSLAGALEVFDAVAGQAGVVRMDSLDGIIEAVEYFIHSPLPKGPRATAITLSGGFKGLLLECAERNGVQFPELAPDTIAALKGVLGDEVSLGNPIDGGFTVVASRQAYYDCIDILARDTNTDVLLLQEELPRQENAKAENLRGMNARVAAGVPKPFAVLSMTSYMLTDYSRTLRKELGLIPFLQEVNKGLRAVGAAGAYAVARRAAEAEGAVPAGSSDAAAKARALLGKARPLGDFRVLNEVDAKALIGAYGIGTPKESVATTADGAVAAARKIGYPVVLKGVAAELTHKTDAGAVMLGLEDDDAVRTAFAAIHANVAKAHPGVELDGVLVCAFVGGGLELVLGIQRDAEMGPVVMFGGGGVALELYKDVTFGAPPLNRARAEAMIAATKAGRLIQGYRGQKSYDYEAVVGALMAVGRLAHDLRDVIESVDVNPFLALPKGGGGVALDALVVLGKNA